MAHGLEIDEATGRVAYAEARDLTQVGDRQVAWHKLGTSVEGAMTAEDALEKSFLSGWDLRTVADVALVEGRHIPTPGKSRVIRTSPFTGRPEVLGHVSGTYEIISNEEGFAFLDVFGDIGGAKFETAGSINNGSRVFVTMRMPEQLLIGGMDPVETYVLFTTTHDGNGSAEGLIVPNRVVCRNTLNMAMGNAIRRVRIRHTKNAVERMQQAAEVLSATNGYVGSIKAASERLAAMRMSLPEVDAFLEQLFPVRVEDGKEPEKAAVTVAETKRQDIRALVQNSPTIQDEYRLTGWGVLNAVAEQFDWFSVVRGADDETARDARRAYRSTIADDGSHFKTKAMKLLLSAA